MLTALLSAAWPQLLTDWNSLRRSALRLGLTEASLFKEDANQTITSL